MKYQDLPCPEHGDECDGKAMVIGPDAQQSGVLWTACGKVFVWCGELMELKEVFDFSIIE